MRHRIRDLRIEAGYKQEYIAKVLDMVQNAYSNYEIGERGIPSEAWCKLADFYNTSVDYLMGRTDVREPYPKSNNE